MTVRGVFTITYIGDDIQILEMFFNRSDGPLHYAACRIPDPAFIVFFIRDAEQQDRAHTGIGGFSARFEDFIDG
jgi:hypothetical protein